MNIFIYSSTSSRNKYLYCLNILDLSLIVKMNLFYYEIALWLFFIHLQSMTESIFKIHFYESTLHTNHGQNGFYIQFHCQSNEKYKSCEIGNLTFSAVQDTCMFRKSNISQAPFPVLMKDKCNKEIFLSQLSYGGIAQSNVDCKIRIKSFDRLGNYMSMLSS